MKKIWSCIKKEPMLFVSLAAAVVSLFITPPSARLLKDIDWKTLATLFMLLSVLDGFKHENLFLPVIRFTGKIRSLMWLGFFLVFSVFFSSMFVTNDVSLIIFVPLTMILYRDRNHEEFILPMLTMENIAAVRGSLLTPFGSPQNLFLFSNSGTDTWSFLGMMLPLWLFSIVLIILFLLFLFRKTWKKGIRTDVDRSQSNNSDVQSSLWDPSRRKQRTVYFLLFLLVLFSIVSRTSLWPLITVMVVLVLLIFDRSVFRRVDYVLLLTFFCFFVFSSSLSANPSIAALLSSSVSGHEYWWSIGISQIISNVPASIVLWPFTTDLKALLYGLDTAGLVSIIGSLASVINLRMYTAEYPGHGKEFMIVFEKISLIFFFFTIGIQHFLL